MRLTFPHREHADVDLAAGEWRLGGAGTDVVLPGAPAGVELARIRVDRRGAWLGIAPDAPGAHLNARPVRSAALLRAGDTLCVEGVQMALCAEPIDAGARRIPARPPAPVDEAGRAHAARVLLRAVSGPQFGRAFPLFSPVLVGRWVGADLRIDDPSVADRHAQVELHGDTVVLRDLGGEGSWLNGRRVKDAVLAPGDQLVFEQQRFVLEAPGLHGRHVPKAAASGPFAPLPPEALPLPDEARGRTMGWLIASALAIAAVIAALLLYAPPG